MQGCVISTSDSSKAEKITQPFMRRRQKQNFQPCIEEKDENAMMNMLIIMENCLDNDMQIVISTPARGRFVYCCFVTRSRYKYVNKQSNSRAESIQFVAKCSNIY